MDLLKKKKKLVISHDEIKAGIGKLQATDQIQPTDCKGKMVLIFLKGGFRKKEVYVTETICGPQSRKYLLSGLLQKKFSIHC